MRLMITINRTLKLYMCVRLLIPSISKGVFHPSPPSNSLQTVCVQQWCAATQV